ASPQGRRYQSDRSESSDEQEVERRAPEDQGRHERETAEEHTARIQREKLRIERRKERERELRMDNMQGNLKRTKFDRDQDRDISEKIALGNTLGILSS